MKGRITRTEPTPERLGLPIIGKIKVGMKSAKGYPMSVDYFIPSGKYAALFAKAYGEKPQTIQIVFPDDDPSKVCNERYEYRNDEGKLVAEGDGETFKMWTGREYKEYSATEYPDIMERIAAKHPNKAVRDGHDGWRVRLTMRFFIPMVRGIGGVWEFETNGTASTIPQIRDAFDMAKEQRGSCTGMIWDMTVKFATSQKPGDKSRYPVVSIVLNHSEENIKKVKEAADAIKLLGQ